jgi:lantibiotic modifying enzyme
MNCHFCLGNYKFTILNRREYHWLEFISHKSCKTEEDIELYYKRAGFILCLVYLLNGGDYHNENIIANGFSPLLIDHETITQPKISERYRSFFKQFVESTDESVLDSFLLPNKSGTSGLPMGRCGFGYHKQTHFHGVEKVGINRFSKDWKMSAQYVTQELSKNNIPVFNDEKVYPKKYLKELLSGFDFCYKLLIEKRTFLLFNNSNLLNRKNTIKTSPEIILNTGKTPKTFMLIN